MENVSRGAHRALCEKYTILWMVTVAVDNLVDIVWVCPVLPGPSFHVKIWDKHGPQHTKGCFIEFEVVYTMMHIREDCTPTSFPLAARRSPSTVHSGVESPHQVKSLETLKRSRTVKPDEGDSPYGTRKMVMGARICHQYWRGLSCHADSESMQVLSLMPWLHL